MRSLGVNRIGRRGVIGPVTAVLLVLLLAVVFSGCQIKLGVRTKVNDNGSGTFGFRLAADKEILDLMAQQGASSTDLFGEVQNNLPKDWKTQEGTDPDGTKWVEVSVDFKNTEDLQTILKDAGSGMSLDLSSLKLTQKKGFFSTTTEYSLKLDMGSALSGVGDIGGGLGSQLTPSVLSSILVLENRVALPGSIKANNATKVEGTTLIWQLQPSGSTEMTATSQSIRWSIVYILIGAVVVLIALLVVIIILLARRGRKQTPPAEAPAADAYVQTAPAAPEAPVVAPEPPAPVVEPAAPVAVPAPAPAPAVNPLVQSIPRATTAPEPAEPGPRP